MSFCGHITINGIDADTCSSNQQEVAIAALLEFLEIKNVTIEEY